jgi:hypothetical protein
VTPVLSLRNALAVRVNDIGVDSEARLTDGTRFKRLAGQRRKEVAAHLRSATDVDDRATPVTDLIVEPEPRIGVPRFPGGAEES